MKFPSILDWRSAASRRQPKSAKYKAIRTFIVTCAVVGAFVTIGTRYHLSEPMIVTERAPLEMQQPFESNQPEQRPADKSWAQIIDTTTQEALCGKAELRAATYEKRVADVFKDLGGESFTKQCALVAHNHEWVESWLRRFVLSGSKDEKKSRPAAKAQAKIAKKKAAAPQPKSQPLVPFKY